MRYNKNIFKNNKNISRTTTVIALDEKTHSYPDASIRGILRLKGFAP
jgi:hypothetical protein